MTLVQFLTRVEDIYLRVRDLGAMALPQLRRQAMTRQVAKTIVSEAEATLELLRQLRLDLDTSDTGAWVVDPLEPQQWLGLTILVREFRARLTRITGELFNLRDMAMQAAEGDDYTVIVANSEDTLQGMAQRWLGDWQAWRQLVAANPGVAVDTLEAGELVQVPNVRPQTG